MSNPGSNPATQSEPPAPAEIVELTMEEKLETAEQRRRDTQAGYTRGQQAIKSLKAENDKLLELLTEATQVKIPEEDKERLEELMDTDPAAWRVEMNALESKARGESRAKVTELTSEVKGAAEQSFELERRQQVLKEFNDSAEVPITEELIANDVPPRITRKLANNEISFDDFLVEVQEYVTTGKVVANEDILDQPNMNNLGGGKTPQDMKPEKSASETYAKETIY